MFYFKKIILVLSCSVLFFFSAFIVPSKKVEAAAPAFGLVVPAGITIGAGAYTVGAWALAGTLGGLGYAANADAINAHSAEVWSKANQLSLDSMNWSIDMARQAGTGAINIGSDLLDFLSGNINELANYFGNYLNPSIPVVSTPTSFYANDVIITRVNKTSGEKATFTSATVDYKVSSKDIPYAELSIGGSIGLKSFSSVGEAKGYISGMSVGQLVNYANENQTGFTWSYKHDSAAFNSTYNNAVSNLTEAWQGMKDAGMVLPVNDAIPFSGGQPLTYNPTQDTYTFPAGNVYDGSVNGPIDWAFPVPRVVPDTVTGKDVVAFPTRAPSITNAKGDVVTGDLTGTWTNVATGEIVTSTTVPEGVIPKPPVKGELDLNKPNVKLSFLPLMMAGELMTEKFPFSIPFDFVKQIKVYDVKPKAPVFKVNVPEYLQIDGLSIPMKFEIDLTFFDMVADILRWGNIVLFDIGLIFMIRRFMPD